MRIEHAIATQLHNSHPEHVAQTALKHATDRAPLFRPQMELLTCRELDERNINFTIKFKKRWWNEKNTKKNASHSLQQLLVVFRKRLLTLNEYIWIATHDSCKPADQKFLLPLLQVHPQVHLVSPKDTMKRFVVPLVLGLTYVTYYRSLDPWIFRIWMKCQLTPGWWSSTPQPKVQCSVKELFLDHVSLQD